MSAVLLAIALLIQGIPVQPQQGGTITGVLRDAEGKPFPGVRIAAVAQPESPTEIQNTAAMSALAETDAEGRYRLENVPPGKYYVAAGSVFIPTYYPGTQELKNGTLVAVLPGASISGIDFRMEDSSVRNPATDFINRLMVSGPLPVLEIPLDIQIEGGGAVPVFGSAGFPQVYLTPAGATVPTMAVAFNSYRIAIPGPSADYKVTVENLPEGYTLKSIAYDSADLRTTNLHVSAGTFAVIANVIGFTVVIAGIPISVPAAAVAPAAPTPRLSITLAKAQPRPSGGVRVTGRAPDYNIRQIYLSGVPGTLFRDGSFEFLGVPPGRHSIATPTNATGLRALAASVVVGDRDVDGIQLVNTPVLPLDIRTPRAPGPAGAHAPGSTIPLLAVRGTVKDKETGQPLSTGTVFLNGDGGVAFHSLDGEGKFEFSNLLPGSYSMQINLAAHDTEARPIVINDGDVNVEIAASKVKD